VQPGVGRYRVPIRSSGLLGRLRLLRGALSGEAPSRDQSRHQCAPGLAPAVETPQFPELTEAAGQYVSPHRITAILREGSGGERVMQQCLGQVWCEGGQGVDLEIIVGDRAGGMERVAKNGLSFCLRQAWCEGGQGDGAGMIVGDPAGGVERIAQQCPRHRGGRALSTAIVIRGYASGSRSSSSAQLTHLSQYGGHVTAGDTNKSSKISRFSCRHAGVGGTNHLTRAEIWCECPRFHPEPTHFVDGLSRRLSRRSRAYPGSL